MAAAGFDGVYVPYLVDDMPSFLDTFSEPGFAGFSVTIPHKVGAAGPEGRPCAGAHAPCIAWYSTCCMLLRSLPHPTHAPAF